MVSELNTRLCANEEGGCSPKGIDTRRCASKDTRARSGGGFGGDPTLIGEKNECRRGRRLFPEVGRHEAVCQ